MKQIVLQYLRKNRGVGRRRRANKRNIACAKNIQSSSYAFNNKDGTAKVTIDLNFTPSSETQLIELSTIFSDTEFSRLKTMYQYYKIDIVNCMFFSSTANGQVYINYATPADELVSIDNDFSRVVSYPMYKIKNVHFNQIKFRTSSSYGVFAFNGWNSTKVTPNVIGEIIIYNKQQISINMKLRCVVRFKGYEGENVVTKSQIKKLQPDKLIVNAEVQTDPVVQEPVKVVVKEEPKKKMSKEEEYVTKAVQEMRNADKQRAKDELDMYRNGELKFNDLLDQINKLIKEFDELVKNNLDKVYETFEEFEESEIFKKHNTITEKFIKLDEISRNPQFMSDGIYMTQCVSELRNKKLSKYRLFDLSCKLYTKPCKLGDFIKT